MLLRCLLPISSNNYNFPSSGKWRAGQNKKIPGPTSLIAGADDIVKIISNKTAGMRNKIRQPAPLK